MTQAQAVLQGPEEEAEEYAGWHRFQPEGGDLMCEAEPYGSFEVFWANGQEADGMPDGWYWWACFPGCLPEGEPNGPFDTSDEAWADAQAGA